MVNIKVLLFDSNYHNLDELKKMGEKERYTLALENQFNDDTAVLSLSDFQYLFNDGTICENPAYIFFHKDYNNEGCKLFTVIAETEKISYDLDDIPYEDSEVFYNSSFASRVEAVRKAQKLFSKGLCNYVRVICETVTNKGTKEAKVIYRKYKGYRLKRFENM